MQRKKDSIFQFFKLLIFSLLNLSTINAFSTYSSRNGILSAFIITIEFSTSILSEELYTAEQYKWADKVAFEKCQKYADYRYHNYTIPGPLIGDPDVTRTDLLCERVEPLIAGGTESVQREFPHMAILFYDIPIIDVNSALCGGSLISEQFIITAAHCLESKDNFPVKWAGLGLLSRKQYISQKSRKNWFPIDNYFPHPKYQEGDTDYQNHDIALLKLENKISLNPDIRPVCIQNEPISIGAKAAVSGWGEDDNGKISDWLMKTVIHNRNISDCDVYNESTMALKNGFEEKYMMCGGHIYEPKGTCPGDSGGPMQLPKYNWDCIWVQVGITSMGRLGKCAQKRLTVYTKVSPYLPWIVETVWPAEK